MKKVLPEFYYLQHFNEFIDYFQGERASQLSPKQRQFIDDFKGLEQQQQCLVARAANRKHGVLRVNSLMYEELDDVPNTLRQLTQLGWFNHPGSASIQDIIDALTKDELLTLLITYAPSLKVKKTSKKAQVAMLLKQNPMAIKHMEVLNQRYIHSQFLSILRQLLFLYFGHLKGSLSQFSMRDLGLLGKRSSGTGQGARFDDCDNSSWAYYYACQIAQIESKPQYFCFPLLENLPPLECNNASRYRDTFLLKLGKFSLIVDPNYAQQCFRLSNQCEAQEAWLKSVFKSGDHDQLKVDLLSLMERPPSDRLALFAEDFFNRKFAQKRTSAMTDMLRSSGQELSIDINYKQSVERGVIEYYRRQGESVFNTENRLWRSLFGLFYWELLFIDNDRLNGFESMPNVLRQNRFFIEKGAQIDELLGRFDAPEGLFRHVVKMVTFHYGKSNSLFHWHKHLLTPIQALITHSSLDSIVSMLRVMATDFKGYKDGFPDIMRVVDNNVVFEEIKAPGDVLRRNQLNTIRKLKSLGINVNITRVQWHRDPLQPYVVVDVETTGGKSEHHRITEIAMVKVIDGQIVEQFQTLVNPQRHIPSAITRLTGISQQMVADAPVFSEIAEQVLSFSENCVFVAHNVNFDYGFVKQELARAGYYFKRPKLCTVQLCRQTFKGLPAYGLASLTQHFGITLDNHHRALDDAKAAAVLFLKTQDYNSVYQSGG